MPTIDGIAAAETLRGFAPLQLHGACLHYVWLACKAHGATSSTTYPTAYSAWQATTKRHTDHNPPAGTLIWLGRRNDGDMAGDVFFSLGGGRAIATDQPTWGKVGECTIAERMLLTRRVYLGWTEDFLGNTLTSTATAAMNATPITEEEDMPTYELIRAANDPTVWFAVDRIQRYGLPSEQALADYQFFIRQHGQSDAVQYPVNLDSFGTPVFKSPVTPTVDTANIVQAIVAALGPQITGTVDVAKIAKAVNDDAAARLAQ